MTIGITLTLRDGMAKRTTSAAKPDERKRQRSSVRTKKLKLGRYLTFISFCFADVVFKPGLFVGSLPVPRGEHTGVDGPSSPPGRCYAPPPARRPPRPRPRIACPDPGS